MVIITAHAIADDPAHPVQVRHLFDGTAVTIRPVRPEDRVLEETFFRHLSPESRYNRFMGAIPVLSTRKLEARSTIDCEREMALVATVARDGLEEEIGAARYAVNPDRTSCEFAIEVADAWQGSGAAGLLMLALMDVARARGLKTMEGLVLSTNYKMLKFVRQLGFTAHHVADDWHLVRVTKNLA